MKRNILLALFAWIALGLSAQISAPSTVFTMSGQLTGADHEFITHITNNANFQLTPSWTRVVNQMPGTWSSAICTGQVCWDTGTSAKPFTAPVAAGGDELVIVHVYDDGQSSGQGTVILAIYDPADSSNNNITLEFTYTAWPLGVVKPEAGDITVYPNPATDYLYVDLGETQAERLQIVDLTGRVVEDNSIPQGFNRATINLSRFTTGTYFIQLVKDGEILATKTIQKN